MARFIVALMLLGLPFIGSADRGAKDDIRSIDDPRVQHRTYVFEETGEVIPYGLFVSTRYKSDTPAPLLVSLHGLGRTYDWLMGYHGLLDYAEAEGYVVVTPLGYTRRGWYGARSTGFRGRKVDDSERTRSEQDVMNVVRIAQNEFVIDPDRIYLWGHSMGGAGTYHLAAQHPELWAAIGLVAPATPDRTSAEELLPRIRHIPAIIVQGTDDEWVPVAQTRSWVNQMRALGMQHLYIEIQDAQHSLLMSQNKENMQKVIEFFNIVRKRYRLGGT